MPRSSTQYPHCPTRVHFVNRLDGMPPRSTITYINHTPSGRQHYFALHYTLHIYPLPTFCPLEYIFTPSRKHVDLSTKILFAHLNIFPPYANILYCQQPAPISFNLRVGHSDFERLSTPRIWIFLDNIGPAYVTEVTCHHATHRLILKTWVLINAWVGKFDEHSYQFVHFDIIVSSDLTSTSTLSIRSISNILYTLFPTCLPSQPDDMAEERVAYINPPLHPTMRIQRQKCHLKADTSTGNIRYPMSKAFRREHATLGFTSSPHWLMDDSLPTWKGEMKTSIDQFISGDKSLIRHLNIGTGNETEEEDMEGENSGKFVK